MPAKSERKFTLLDLMILVAGLALGLGLTLTNSATLLLVPFSPIDPSDPGWGNPWTPKQWSVWALHTFNEWFFYLMPLLVWLTATLLVIRLRSPRPRVARLMRQPRIVAMVVVVAAFVAWVPFLAVREIVRRPGIDFELILWNSMRLLSVASAIIASWITLRLGGRWRADPGWIDRLGRFLGVLWIGEFSLCMLRVML